MNHWDTEFNAEYDRQRILKEVEHIRLEKLARPPHTDRPHRLGRIVLNFANWMISTGRQLRKRYKDSAVNGNDSRTGSPAN